MYKFDCTNINGVSCKYLGVLKHKRTTRYPDIYMCSKHNIVLFPDKINEGRINEYNDGLSPEFNCVKMQKLRHKGICPNVMFSIKPDRSTTFWNPKINTQ